MIAATVNAVAAARCSPAPHQRFAPGVGRGEHLVVLRLPHQPVNHTHGLEAHPFGALTDPASPCDNSGVGLEDRDWYRERPSDAWNSQWDERTRETSSGFMSARVRPGAWLAIAVSAAATAVIWKFDLLEFPLSTRDSPVLSAPQQPGAALTPTPRPSNEVDLSGNPALRVRATTPGSGRSPIRGSNDRGTRSGRGTPLTVIARELTRRGYQAVLPAAPS